MTSSNYHIKPLDGSPLMSANCWNAVLEALKQRGRSAETVRCLEWGGGNSTISLLRIGLDFKKGFEFDSIDHDTRFFPFLAESAISEFLAQEHATTEVRWKPLVGPRLTPSRAREIMSRHRRLKAATIDWQIATGNKRIQFAEGVSPFFGFFTLKLAKQKTKFLLIKLEYLLWLLKGVVRNYLRASRSTEPYSFAEASFHLFGEGIQNGLFFDYFHKRPLPGCLEIKHGQTMVRLWHLPELKTLFWRKGVLFDGSIEQLPEFVGAPLEGKFDLVFVDGRARVSCIKRTYYDKLLKEGGFLFVHDAYRTEMIEGFKLFTPTPTFIQGSNVMLNGNIRCNENFGYPLIKTGKNAKKLDYRIAQELFMHQN